MGVLGHPPSAIRIAPASHLPTCPHAHSRTGPTSVGRPWTPAKPPTGGAVWPLTRPRRGGLHFIPPPPTPTTPPVKCVLPPPRAVARRPRRAPGRCQWRHD